MPAAQFETLVILEDDQHLNHGLTLKIIEERVGPLPWKSVYLKKITTGLETNLGEIQEAISRKRN